VDSNSAILQWESGNSDCYPVQEFLIYDNGKLIQKVPFPTLTTRVTDLFNCTTNEFYVTAIIYRRPSAPSNSLSVFINLPYGPTITSFGSVNCSSEIRLEWEMTQAPCYGISSYNIYLDGTASPIANTTDTFYDVPTVITPDCTLYSFYVTAVFDDIASTESLKSNTVQVNQKPCPPILSLVTKTETTVDISWPTPSSNCTIISYDLYRGQEILIANITSSNPNNTYQVTGLTQGTTYTFYARSIGIPNESNNSTPLTVTTTVFVDPVAPTNLSVTFCYKQATLSWNPVSGATGYNLYLNDSTSSVATVTGTTYTYLNLLNSTPYVFKVSSVINNEESSRSSLSDTLPTTQSYFTLGNKTSEEVTVSSYTVYFAYAPGSIAYNINACPSVNVLVTMTVVGGGGGGAGGQTNNTAGGGGGAGGQVLVQSLTFTPNGSVNITGIGIGGIGGSLGGDGGSGGDTTVAGANSYIASGGGGGKSIAGTGGNGGSNNGGNGSVTSGGDGVPGGSGSSGYSGGGGGGALSTQSNGHGGGLSGFNSTGGAGGNNNNVSSNSYGQDATTYGTGGGGGVGGATFPSIIVAGEGGDGFQGIVKFVIPN
jgi:hypothetical protein